MFHSSKPEFLLSISSILITPIGTLSLTLLTKFLQQSLEIIGQTITAWLQGIP